MAFLLYQVDLNGTALTKNILYLVDHVKIINIRNRKAFKFDNKVKVIRVTPSYWETKMGQLQNIQNLMNSIVIWIIPKTNISTLPFFFYEKIVPFDFLRKNYVTIDCTG